MMTLALLLTAATGAWATDYTTLAVGDVIKVGDTFTPSADGGINDWGVDNGVTYTLIRADVGNGVTEKTDGAYYVFKFVSGLDPYIHFDKAFAVTATSDGLVVTNIETVKGGVLSYTLAVHEPAPAATPVDIDWDAASPNTATLTNGMPAGNVTVNVKYFPQAEFAKSTDATLAPTAIADVPATTDAPIVKAGTVANIGSTETAQGTVMYYVSTTEMTDDDLLALDADKWSADVPTAESLAEGPAYVYYYIKGAEPATIAERTDANTCSDGDILAANVVNVTLAAAPLWNAEFDLTNAPEEDKAPGVWSTDIPEGGVVKGTEVTVTYTGTKKIIGVKAEKKSAFTPLDNTITAWTAGKYAVPAGGLTYSDAITVSGDVTLTLTDGEILTLNKGISLASGATLTIEGNGTMNINGTNNSTASTVAGSTGTLKLTSGTLTATGGNGGNVYDGASHGGNGGDAINGSVIVSGGTLTARGGNGGSVGNEIDNSTGGNGGDAISGTLTINGGSTSVNDGSNGSIGSDSYHCTAGTGGKAVVGTVTDNR